MKKILGGIFLTGAALLRTGDCLAAVDSYRYLHVTIETPWSIFLVLLPMVLAPLILMAVLVWRYTERRAEQESEGQEAQAKEEE